MKCTKIEQLLALYIEDDLTAKRARAVSHHLMLCDRCSILADEYRESQRRLRLHEPPEFADAFFDDIKRAVRREIESAPPVSLPSVLPALLAGLFTRRPGACAAAAAAAVLMVVSAGLALRFYRDSPGEGAAPVKHIARVETADRGAKDSSPPSTAEQIASGAEVSELPLSNESHVFAPRATNRRQNARLRRLAPLMRHTHAGGGRTAGLNRALRPPPAEVAIGADAAPPIGPADLARRAAQVASINEDTAAGGGPSGVRIEMQTSDPNIRIIWLSSRANDALPSNK